MFGGVGNGPRLPAAPGSWDFPQLCPHCLPEAICGASLVEPLARLDGSRGNILLVPTSWLRHHSPAWPPLPQISPCSPLKGHSGTGGPQGTLTLSLEGPGAEDGQAPPPQTKVGCHPGMVLPSSLCLWLREGCEVPWNQTVLMTVFYTLPWSPPKPPGRSPCTQSDFPVPRRDSAPTPGSPIWVSQGRKD